MTHIELGPDEPLPLMTEDQLRQLGDIQPMPIVQPQS